MKILLYLTSPIWFFLFFFFGSHIVIYADGACSLPPGCSNDNQCTNGDQCTNRQNCTYCAWRDQWGKCQSWVTLSGGGQCTSSVPPGQEECWGCSGGTCSRSQQANTSPCPAPNNCDACPGSGGGGGGQQTCFQSTPFTDTFTVGSSNQCKVTIVHEASYWPPPAIVGQMPTGPGTPAHGYKDYDTSKIPDMESGKPQSWPAGKNRGIGINDTDTYCKDSLPDGANLTIGTSWQYTNSSVQLYSQKASVSIGNFISPAYDIKTSGCSVNPSTNPTDCTSTDTGTVNASMFCHDSWCSPNQTTTDFSLHYCGNGVCECGETFTSCPQDCPCPPADKWTTVDTMNVSTLDSTGSTQYTVSDVPNKPQLDSVQAVSSEDSSSPTSSVKLGWTSSLDTTATSLNMYAQVFKKQLSSNTDGMSNGGWTVIDNVEGSSNYPIGATNADLSSITPSYASITKSDGSQWKSNDAFVSNQIATDIANNVGYQIAIVWGIQGTNICGATIDGTNQLERVVFYRDPQVMSFTANGRGNIQQVSANADLNYYNNLANNVTYPQPLLPLPSGQSDYANPIINSADQSVNVTSNAKGPGGSSTDNVGNPVTYYAYYRSLDGVKFIDTAVLGLVYNDGSSALTPTKTLHTHVYANENDSVTCTLDGSTGCAQVSIVGDTPGDGGDNGDGNQIEADAKVVGIYTDRGPGGPADVELVRWRVKYLYNRPTPSGKIWPENNQESNGFGDGDFYVYSQVGNSQWNSYAWENYPTPYSASVKTNDATVINYWQMNNADSISLGALYDVSGLSAPSAALLHPQVGDWIVLVTPPAATATIDTVTTDAKHVTLSWTASAAATSKPGVPSSFLGLRMIEKNWNPQETGAKTSSNPETTSKWNGTSGYEQCGSADSAYANTFTPPITECTDPTTGNVNSPDKAVGTTDITGPIISDKEYTFRLIVSDNVGNYAIPYYSSDVLAPWAQIINGDVYGADGFSLYLPQTAGQPSTSYFSMNNVCNSGNGGRSLNGSCTDFADTDTAHNLSALDPSLNKYGYQYFFNLCSQIVGGGGCDQAADADGSGGSPANWYTQGNKYELPSTLDSSTNTNKGWVYVPGNLYVNFDPTSGNCVAGNGNTCIPDPNNPEGKNNADTGTKYSGNAVIIVNGTLYIEPDMVYADESSGYIFIVKKGIDILAPKMTSAQNASTDYVDGMFLTDGVFKTEAQIK